MDKTLVFINTKCDVQFLFESVFYFLTFSKKATSQYGPC